MPDPDPAAALRRATAAPPAVRPLPVEQRVAMSDAYAAAEPARAAVELGSRPDGDRVRQPVVRPLPRGRSRCSRRRSPGIRASLITGSPTAAVAGWAGRSA